MNKGFTLIELIISVAVFLLVVGTASTIFIYTVNHQRRILADAQLLNQISYVKEYMSKALRMAIKDEEGSCLPKDYIYMLTRVDESGFYRGIKFINQSADGVCQEFFLDNAVPGDTSAPLILKELKNSNNLDDAVPLTSDSLKLEFVRFGINGASGCYGGENCPDGASLGDGIQPRVTILFNVKASEDSEESGNLFQTTVSQRNLNTQ